MHIADLKDKPANSCIDVDSLLVQHQLRSSIENHTPLVIALTHLGKTIKDAELEIKSGKTPLSNDEKELAKEAAQFIRRATLILIVASNHQYSFSRSFDVLSSLLDSYCSLAARAIPEGLLLGYTNHVLHENYVDLHEAFLAKHSAAELVCDHVGSKFRGEVSVGIGNKSNFQVHKWTAHEFFKELKEFDYEIKSIGSAEISKLQQEVVTARVLGKKPFRKM